MKTLQLEQYENIVGGSDFTDGLCAGVGIAALVASTNFWNPVGWVAGALFVAGSACVIDAFAGH